MSWNPSDGNAPTDSGVPASDQDSLWPVSPTLWSLVNASGWFDNNVLSQVPEILRMVTPPQILEYRLQTQIVWDQYLSSVRYSSNLYYRSISIYQIRIRIQPSCRMRNADPTLWKNADPDWNLQKKYLWAEYYAIWCYRNRPHILLGSGDNHTLKNADPVPTLCKNPDS